MPRSSHRRRFDALYLVLPFCAALAICSIATACEEEKKDYVIVNSDGEITPTMTTRNVETFISDSGITRYRIISPVWYVFDNSREPNWKFPEGLFLQQYDDNFRPDASVICDSAKYLSEKRLWRLDGHVTMVNVERDSFLTQQLFWDQKARKIYTDSFIHIVRTDRIIEGYGMTSNEQMTEYVVHKPSAILPVGEIRGENSDDSVSARTPRRGIVNDSINSGSQQAADEGENNE